MFHRRVDEKKKDDDIDCCQNGGVCNNNNVTQSQTSNVSQPPPRKSRPRIVKKKHFNSNTAIMKHVVQTLLDEDLIISLIQVISGIILVGCGFILLSHWFGDGLFSFTRPRVHIPGQPYPRVPLKPSRHYTIPNSMSHIGDKSDPYALLRKEYDSKMNLLSPTDIYTKEAYQQFAFTPMPMTNDEPNDPQPLEQVPYDIYNCPDEPPAGYPFAWTLKDVLNHWGPDDANPPTDFKLHQGLCVFDYQTEFEKAQTYREAEVPFVLQNDPQVHAAVYRWNQPNYLERMLGYSVKHRAEYSESNHFLYWVQPPKKRRNNNNNNPLAGLRKKNKDRPWNNPVEKPADWKEPTEMLRITYSEWLSHANITDESMLGPDQPHWYFRLIGCGETGPEGQCDAGSSEYLFDELTFFQPKESLYIVDPDQQKGIHCRFGMKGVIAENHFDGSRNMIAVMGGARRYVLAHPNQCPYLSLLPKGHPSARHSAIDWSDPDYEKYPEFALAKGNEVVLQAGDVMYLPTNWFHYIVSLTLNFQCNTRSGISNEYMPPIRECGF